MASWQGESAGGNLLGQLTLLHEHLLILDEHTRDAIKELLLMVHTHTSLCCGAQHAVMHPNASYQRFLSL
jgi:hypothetical protein